MKETSKYIVIAVISFLVTIIITTAYLIALFYSHPEFLPQNIPDGETIGGVGLSSILLFGLVLALTGTLLEWIIIINPQKRKKERRKK